MSAFQAAVETYLVDMGHLSPEQLKQARQYQEKTSCSLGKALWSLNLMAQPAYLQALSDVTGHPIYTQWLPTSHVLVDFTLARAFDPGNLSQIGFFPYA